MLVDFLARLPNIVLTCTSRWGPEELRFSPSVDQNPKIGSEARSLGAMCSGRSGGHSIAAGGARTDTVLEHEAESDELRLPTEAAIPLRVYLNQTDQTIDSGLHRALYFIGRLAA
jgi:hypothetical protein